MVLTPYHARNGLYLYAGDAKQVISCLPEAGIQTTITSPPYFGLRSYLSDDDPEKSLEIGSESSLSAYIDNLVTVFSAVWDATCDDGTLWVNLGDSYTPRGVGRIGTDRLLSARGIPTRPPRPHGMKPKNLVGVPWLLAFTLQDAGWILRNDIIWRKTNPMPFSGKDRLASTHEHFFLFSKQPHYYFDLDAVRVPHRSDPSRAGKNALRGQAAIRKRGPNAGRYHPLGKNPGDVWDIATRPFPGAHYATFPPELPRRAILASTKVGDTVLDPFMGSGTTGMVALELGRRFVGVDLDSRSLDLALRTRFKEGRATN